MWMLIMKSFLIAAAALLFSALAAAQPSVTPETRRAADDASANAGKTWQPRYDFVYERKPK